MLINSPLPIDTCTGLERTCTKMMNGSTGTVAVTNTTFRVDIDFLGGGVSRLYGGGGWDKFDDGVSLFVADEVITYNGNVTSNLRFMSNDQLGIWRVRMSANAAPGSAWAQTWQDDIGDTRYTLEFGGSYTVPAVTDIVDVPTPDSLPLLLGGLFAMGLLKVRRRKK